MAGGFTTVTRRAEVAQARYEAAREAAALRAEAASLESEKTALEGNLSRIVVALEKARQTYRDGAIVASVGGTVGAKVVPAGTVLRPGEALADIYHGDKYVIAYLPTSRLYPIAIGKPVIVTDGVNRHKGHIERIEGITDAVPAEFQSNFRSVERQQVARVMMDDVNSLPLLSKIKVTSTHSPANLLAEATGCSSPSPEPSIGGRRKPPPAARHKSRAPPRRERALRASKVRRRVLRS
ncbi:MAG: HlyD family efflux transporter periplasmic adaptor subunit, partial [Rhodoplanes sp.]